MLTPYFVQQMLPLHLFMMSRDTGDILVFLTHSIIPLPFSQLGRLKQLTLGAHLLQSRVILWDLWMSGIGIYIATLKAQSDIRVLLSLFSLSEGDFLMRSCCVF